MTQTQYTPGRGIKSDSAARQAWGSVYDAIPKSAFALVAFHLSNLCAEQPDDAASIMARFLEEVDALALNGIMLEAHAKAARATISKARGKA